MANANGPNFLDLPAPLSDLETAQVGVLCLPYEATTSYGQGTQDGPAAIVAASTQVELYDEELDHEPCDIGIATVDPIAAFDRDHTRALQQIQESCQHLLNQGKFVVSLGGEHSVTIPLVRAFKKFYPDLWVLQLDAHSDLRDCYHGSRESHACVMARIGEACPFIGVGIRSGIRGERQALSPPSQMYYAFEMQSDAGWQDEVCRKLGSPVYITIDLDFFDPGMVPSVGTPEPGGFHWYETLAFLRKVVRSHRVVGFDVVELCPQPGFPASDFFAARLVYKLIGYVFQRELPATIQEKS